MRVFLTLRARQAVLIGLVMLVIALPTAIPVGGAAKALITIDDLRWQGTYAFPLIGEPTPGGAGTTTYASGALAVRYVGGQRRILMPTFTQADPATGQTFGDLVEWQEPPQAAYSGADPTQAPKMIEVRRWKNWTILGSTPSWQEKSNGIRIGGLLWDESTGVLWYQLYGYYSGKNHPLLGATRLLDTPTTGNYRAVGQQYGPWWYRNNDPSETSSLYWKAVCNWMVRVPPSAQSALNGHSIILGGTVGSLGSQGNLGPGFRAIPQLPSLSDPPNSVIPVGLRLADYTSESPLRPSHARRNVNYQNDGIPYSSNDSGLPAPTASVGYWQMNLDHVNSFIWVETASKQGILLFGRQATGLTWYGWNPRSLTPGWTGAGPEAVDLSRPVPNGNGYGSTAFAPALYVFDPEHVKAVAQGARSPWADGMNPVATYNWKTKWPNMPVNRAGGANSRPIETWISNSGFWDTTTEDILWIQPSSVGAGNLQPTLNVFRLTPRPPTNLRITG